MKIFPNDMSVCANAMPWHSKPTLFFIILRVEAHIENSQDRDRAMALYRSRGVKPVQLISTTILTTMQLYKHFM